MLKISINNNTLKHFIFIILYIYTLACQSDHIPMLNFHGSRPDSRRNMSSCRFIATYWIKNTKTVQFYVFDRDMEAQVNMRCSMDGFDKENMATVQVS